ncbi:894_t:CDS:2 [Paraglomus brasilianum]|uniref:894_t:CDS:1 n=1 Tax=Paraglomus brasilianum TaxID=144538 RepID=A0A9N8W4C5_9GLOM|nr:894_t:CDS:2 [Paraglomus brasilianum]
MVQRRPPDKKIISGLSDKKDEKSRPMYTSAKTTFVPVKE